MESTEAWLREKNQCGASDELFLHGSLFFLAVSNMSLNNNSFFFLVIVDSALT